MDIKQQFTTVTRFSKIVALILFIVLPFLGFYLGMQYSKAINTTQPNQISENNATPIVCTQEAKVCPDGSSVGRTGPSCEFAECPVLKDETASWKTYTNNQYGFEFQYPAEWGDITEHQSKVTNDFNSLWFSKFVSVDKNGSTGVSNFIAFGIEYDLSTGKPVDIIADSNFKKGQKVFIGDKEGFYLHSGNEGNQIAVPLKNNAFLIIHSDPSTFGEVLNTFKFTK